MRAPTSIAFLACLLLGCSGSGAESADAAAADTAKPTKEQRDSVLGESKLPGAGGVKAAREVNADAAARAAAMDSIR